MKIVVIGSGNVAQAFCKVISESDMELVQVFARSRIKAAEIARRYGCSFASQPEELSEADLYIMAITEESIASLSSQLDFGNAVVVHTSGVLSTDKLHPCIINKGVIYPIQILTKWRDVDFRNTPILIEGTTPRAVACIRQFANTISDCVKEYTFEQRLNVHLAAVFAHNFSNHMYTISEHILNRAGLSFELMKPLILEAVNQTIEQESPKKIQTDLATRIIHYDILNNDLDYQTIYINLSNDILRTFKKP